MLCQDWNPFYLSQFFRKKIDVGTLTNHGFTVKLCKLWELL
ncbi:hypothetical protein LEP1GSC082_0472 [Leptospira kirschneri str. H2]|nr:hypothetical protein LEP1GSC082_0472 [Leptospira kirschneri str. H2]